jgi:hypothetical protein
VGKYHGNEVVMKIKEVHAYEFSPGKILTSARADVEGIGEVTFKDCLFAETVTAIQREAEMALRARLGQVLPRPCTEDTEKAKTPKEATDD